MTKSSQRINWAWKARSPQLSLTRICTSLTSFSKKLQTNPLRHNRWRSNSLVLPKPLRIAAKMSEDTSKFHSRKWRNSNNSSKSSLRRLLPRSNRCSPSVRNSSRSDRPSWTAYAGSAWCRSFWRRKPRSTGTKWLSWPGPKSPTTSSRCSTISSFSGQSS